MIDSTGLTIGAAFDLAAARHGPAPFLCIPADAARAWNPEGVELSYAEIAAQVAALRARLAQAGCGPGHRIALHLENRPAHVAWKLAMNALGVSCVPINPDLRPAEIAYILEDSAPDLAVVAPPLRAQFDAAMALGRPVPVVGPAPQGDLPAPRTRAAKTFDDAQEASLVYTSGTTGRPKGCILSHAYELELGRWYLATGGRMAMSEGERLYNPLPLFHVNAGILTIFAMMLSGGCQIQPARFSRAAWWRDIRDCRASIAHYLGVVIPALMAVPESPDDKAHGLRMMVGAGVEPSLHRPCEARFGVPLIEVWGMTEMCRAITAHEDPRHIDTRAFGRARPGLEVRVVEDVDGEDRDVPVGAPGEMIMRHSAATPRKGFFSGYLNKPEATAEAWRGGWFHTGDTVRMDESGMLFFIDRKKNIIRRSGENIAAAEVEAVLHGHAAVAQAAALAVPDPIRDEEVYACVVLKDGVAPDAAMARTLFDHAFDLLAYYKPPGWLRFVPELPVTGTQKVQKHQLFAPGQDPTALPGVHDFRDLKKKTRQAG